MTASDDFKRLDDLFQAVCDLPEDQREARLIELAPNDERIRSEVLELLAQESRGGGSEALAPEAVQQELHRAIKDTERDPTEIAGYRVLSRLGAGGMGVVYEAQQSSPRRTVALKVLRPGLATPNLIRRFEFEAEALGRLRHPGIAQIFEAGVAETETGPRPYFAMELVRGLPIDHWAATTNATPRERLRLFAAVCDAVQHAHAQGVIHRDLKPANILVATDAETGESVDAPIVKVLDFGVARATERTPADETIHTAQGQLVGTLPYMSPEQLGGQPADVDTRSDVFSLGVLLFQLMSGKLPHDTTDRGLVEAARVIREDEPTRLSTLEPKLRGDIETIAALALNKDKSRRYQSAAALAEDIRRHLDGLTITARPPSAIYQLSRLAKRHKPAAIAATVALTALVGAVVGVSASLGVALEQRTIARAQTAEAERRAALAEAVTSFFNNDVLAAVVPSALGHEATVREAIDTAAVSLDGRFDDEPVTEAAIRNNIANVYHALGEFDAAMPMAERAIELFQSDLGPDHELTRMATQDLGSLYRDTARFDEARVILTDLLAHRDSTVGPEHPETLENIVMLAEIERDGFGDTARALELLDEFDARRTGVLEDDDRITVYALMTRGGLALAARDYEAAADAYLAVAEAREAMFGQDHSATRTAWHNVAVAYEGLGRYDEAEPIYTRGLAFAREQAGPDNPDTLVTAHNLAFLYESMGRYDEAEPLFIDTLERCRRVFGPLHPGTLTCTMSLSSLFRNTDRLDEAVALLEPVYRTAADELGTDAVPTIEIATRLAVMLVEADRPEDGQAMFADTVPAVRGMVPSGHPMLGSLLSQWGVSLARVGEPAAAADRLEEAYAILSAAPGAEQAAGARTAAERLAEVYEEMGVAPEAAKWRSRASDSEPAADAESVRLH
ncbi:MAG: serine/threonine-protein kinase [Planctomycetota bacterium]